MCVFIVVLVTLLSTYSYVKDESKNTILTVMGIVIILLILFGILISVGGNNSRSEKEIEYCRYIDCHEKASQFWNDDTGYCNQHAELLREEYNISEERKRRISE